MDIESILNTIRPFALMAVALLSAFMVAVWISVVIWTFRDIRSRTRDILAQLLATLMVLAFFPLGGLGVLLYYILRPPTTLVEMYERSLEEEALLQDIEDRLACPGCNRTVEEDFMICPTCHTRLKKACPACGRLLHMRWNVCPYCGALQATAKQTALEEAVHAPPPGPPPEPEPSPDLQDSTDLPFEADLAEPEPEVMTD
jgi:RNA polymerase subunit RPABC4/transcription elongation factor Spt4